MTVQRIGRLDITYRPGHSGPAMVYGVRESDYAKIRALVVAHRLAGQVHALMSDPRAGRYAKSIFASSGIKISSLTTPPVEVHDEVVKYRTRAGGEGVTQVGAEPLLIHAIAKVELTHTRRVDVHDH